LPYETIASFCSAGSPGNARCTSARSAIAIVAVPRVRLEAAIPAAIDQMTMGSEETLRLKAPRVVKALEN
jgi:hypothetical protein